MRVLHGPLWAVECDISSDGDLEVTVKTVDDTSPSSPVGEEDCYRRRHAMG